MSRSSIASVDLTGNDVNLKRKREEDSHAKPNSQKLSSIDEMLMEKLKARPKQKIVTLQDLEKVENAIQTLGESIRTIMDLTPDVYTHTNPLIQDRIDAPKIKLAQYLMSISHLGYFRQVERLVCDSLGTLDRVEATSFPPIGVFKKALKRQDADLELPKAMIQGFKRGRLARCKSESSNRSRQVNNWPPPLPEITDDKLLCQVFTHKSVGKLHDYLTETELMEKDNERLEFLGDSILNNLITVIIYERFPYMHEGDLSNLRTALITNNTLSEWAKIYGMEKTLKFYGPEKENKKVVGGRGAAASTPKYVADVFEAYVGGLWVLHGSSSGALEVIRPWLEELASPMLLSVEEGRKGTNPLDFEAKKTLYVKIGSVVLSPTYVTTRIMSNGHSVVECRMGYDVLAVASGSSAKEAGMRAATEALKKTDLIDKYAKLRREVPRVIPTESSAPINVEPMSEPVTPTEVSPVPSSPGKNSKIELDFLNENEASLVRNPKQYLEALFGTNKNVLKYTTTQTRNTDDDGGDGEEDSDNSAKIITYKSTLYLGDTNIGEATGHTIKSAEKRAAYFSISKNHNLIQDWLNDDKNKSAPSSSKKSHRRKSKDLAEATESSAESPPPPPSKRQKRKERKKEREERENKL